MPEEIDMRRFALLTDGKFFQSLEPIEIEGVWYAVSAQVPAWQFETLIDITNMDPQPQQGWEWDGTMFHPPHVYVPTPEEIAGQRENYRQQLIREASIAMAPVLLSLNLGDANDDETVTAKAWQSYYRDLMALQISGEGDEPEWPSPPAI